MKSQEKGKVLHPERNKLVKQMVQPHDSRWGHSSAGMDQGVLLRLNLGHILAPVRPFSVWNKSAHSQIINGNQVLGCVSKGSLREEIFLCSALRKV